MLILFDDIVFNFAKVRGRISFIDKAISKSLSSVCWTSTSIKESNPKATKLVSGLIDEGSLIPEIKKISFVHQNNTHTYIYIYKEVGCR